MAAPSYAAAGAGAQGDPSAGGAAIPFPTGISAGHLLLLQVWWNVSTTFASADTPPSGFTLLYDDDMPGTTSRCGVYAKSAVGTESGNLTGPLDADPTICLCRIYRFTDWKNDATMANNFEGASVSGPTTSNTIADAGVTTTAADRLAVNFVFVSTSTALDSFTGETGGDWTEAVAEYSWILATIQLQTATMAAAGTINGGTYPLGASPEWLVRGFAILPVAASLPSDTPIYVFGRGAC